MAYKKILVPVDGSTTANLGRVSRNKLIRRMLRALIAGLVATLAAGGAPFAAEDVPLASPDVLAARYVREVEMRLEVPPFERETYAALLGEALLEKRVGELPAQYFLLIDRNPQVQAAFVYWGSPVSGWRLIGASPVATGLPGRFDYFLTPLGVFEHTLANSDFRAEGTRNKNGIRGYGVKGMRVYDFGWVQGERGWGRGGTSSMRLQVHATDPDLLEPLLGEARSKGCIRIPASLNVFLDRFGLLDADYEAALQAGGRLWMLRADRAPAQGPGRYLVIVDSARAVRPSWSPAPGPRRAKRATLATNAC